MTDKFGASDDNTQNANSGTTFGNEGPSDQGGTNGQVGSSDDVEALRRRDEHAQTHIVRLESENKELRDRITELDRKLANAKTIDDALSRMNKPNQTTSVDPDQLADAVGAKLTEREQVKKQDSNWETVVTKLTETFGEWKKADSEIQLKARELGLSAEDATNLARRSPQAFYDLFLPKASTTGTAGSARSAGVGQTAASTHTGEVRNQAYYTKLRREEPNKFWSVDNQMQMRRDLGYVK